MTITLSPLLSLKKNDYLGNKFSKFRLKHLCMMRLHDKRDTMKKSLHEMSNELSENPMKYNTFYFGYDFANYTSLYAYLFSTIRFRGQVYKNHTITIVRFIIHSGVYILCMFRLNILFSNLTTCESIFFFFSMMWIFELIFFEPSESICV